MAAYNWVDVTACCPVCAATTSIRCQTHTASSFDGDETGHFCHREYRLGERMVWAARLEDWKATHPCIRVQAAPETCEESCCSRCEACGASLCVALRFVDLTPVAVLSISVDGEYPNDCD